MAQATILCGCGVTVESPEGGSARALHCPACGSVLSDRAAGRPPIAPGREPTSRLALASLVLGVLAFPLAAATALPAVVAGVLALRRIGRDPGRTGGRRLARLGIKTACLAVVGWVAFLALVSYYRFVRGPNATAAVLKPVAPGFFRSIGPYRDVELVPEAGVAVFAALDGTVRVHALADLSLRATYKPDRPAVRVAVDATRGDLYTFTLDDAWIADPSRRALTEQGYGTGAIQVYEARRVLAGEDPGSTLVSLQRVELDGTCDRLEVSPDRRWVFALVSDPFGVDLGPYPGPRAAKLMRFDGQTHARAGVLELRPGTTMFRFSVDGRSIYAPAATAGFDRARRPGSGRLQVVNADTLALDTSYGVETDPCDVAVDAAGFAYVAGGSGGTSELLLVDVATGFGTVAGWPGFAEGSRLALAPEGARLFSVSGNTPSGTLRAWTLADAVDDAPSPAGEAAGTPDQPVSGRPTVTPDGQFVLLPTGSVFRVARPGS